MTKVPDAIATGKLIRKIRKEKNITLQVLSTGICSVGKMSNIEHGHAKPDLADLELIAKKLGVTIEQLLYPNDHDTEYESFTQQLNALEVLISIDSLEMAKNHIDIIRNDFKELLKRKPSLNISLLYLEGILHRELQNDSISLSKFYQLLEQPVENKKEICIRSKTYMQLGQFEYKNNKYSFATLEKYKSALNELIKNKLSVSWELYYNLYIMYLQQREYFTAKGFLQNIQQKNAHTTYATGLVQLFLLNFEEGFRNVDKARSMFIKSDNKELMLKSIFASIYFNQIDDSKGQRVFMDTINKYVNNNIEITKLSNHIQIKLSITLYQSLALYYLKQKDKDMVTEQIERIEKMELQYDFKDCRHITLSLRAFYIKAFSPNEEDTRISLLHEALEKCKLTSESTHLQITLLSELAEINGERGTYSFRALEVTNQVSILGHLDFQFFDLFLPNIIHID